MRIFFVIIFVLFVSANMSFSQNDSVVQYAKNCIYPEFVSLIFLGSISLNYERMLSETTSIRAGIGGALTALPNPAGGGSQDDDVISLTVMYNYLSTGTHKFETGIGLALPLEGDYKHFVGNPIAMSLGYRYQKKPTGGFVFRTGLSWVYCYGLGIHLSLGKSF